MNKYRIYLSDFRTLLGLWVLLPIVSWLLKAFSASHYYNNFLIYRYVYWHTVQGSSLYAPCPFHEDVNHYGPFFSLIIAPFAIPPIWLGLLFWLVSLSLLLYLAVRHSSFSRYQQLFILWFCAHELFTSLEMQQFNIAVVALIMLSYTLIEKERDFWAAFCICLGAFVKLYGIMGLAFILFSKHQGKLVISLLLWGLVMFIAPIIISSPDYVVSQYGEWYNSLTCKNTDNLFSYYQNISLLGMVRKISGISTYSDLWLLAPGALLYALPFLRFSQYQYAAFRQTLLASVLLVVVIFSTGSENSSYIIALVGVVIWYTAAPWSRGKVDLCLMVLVFVLSSLGHSDLFPSYIRNTIIRPYALKALPCVIVWLKLCYELYIKNYAPIGELNKNKNVI